MNRPDHWIAHRQKIFGKLLVELNRDESVALIVVTHSLDLARGLDRTYEMRDGSLVEAKL